MDAGTATVQEELPCEFSSFPYSCPEALYTVHINYVVSCRKNIELVQILKERQSAGWNNHLDW